MIDAAGGNFGFFAEQVKTVLLQTQRQEQVLQRFCPEPSVMKQHQHVNALSLSEAAGLSNKFLIQASATFLIALVRNGQEKRGYITSTPHKAFQFSRDNNVTSSAYCQFYPYRRRRQYFSRSCKQHCHRDRRL